MSLDQVKVAEFIERSATVVNEQAAEIQKHASAHDAAVKFVPRAVEAARNAGFIAEAELQKAAAAFSNHEALLKFFIKVADHISKPTPELGAGTTETTKTASANTLDEATTAMAKKLGCLEELTSN